MPNMRDLSFATINLLNLQAPGRPTYEGDKPPFPDDEGGRRAYAAKIEFIARHLALMDTDVIGFQEVWSAQALEEAFAASGLLGQYDLVARDAPGIGRPQVALAVRRDASGRTRLRAGADWIASFPAGFVFDGLRETDGARQEITVTIDEFSRPILRAVIQPAGARPAPPPVVIYVAHLKSKGPARLSFARPLPAALERWPQITKSAVAHIRRVMEAAAMRAMLDAEMTEEVAALSPTVVLGDLNDDTLSVTTELISGQPTYRVVSKSQAGRKSDRGLYTVEQLQQYRSLRHVYYTHIYRNKRESLDHILVSEEFYDHSLKRRWSFREMEVYNDHLNRESFEDHGASDHGFVRAAFDWNPMPDIGPAGTASPG